MYALWAYPDLLPAFSTWPPVLQKLAGGAGKRTRTLSHRVAKRNCLLGFLVLSFPVTKMYLELIKSIKNTYSESNSCLFLKKENKLAVDKFLNEKVG